MLGAWRGFFSPYILSEFLRAKSYAFEIEAQRDLSQGYTAIN